MATVRCLFVLGLIVLSTRACAQTIVDGPIRYQGHRYYLVDAPNFVAAEAKAVAMRGTVVTINDQDENEFVRASVANAGGTPRKVFIGLNDRTTEGTFVWADGAPAAYTNWAPGEPNNHESRDHTYLYPNDTFGGQWFCVPDTYTPYSVIEIQGPLRVPEEFPTVAEAVSMAANGESIDLAPGVHSMTSGIGIQKTITILSRAGSRTTILRGESAHPLL